MRLLLVDMEIKRKEKMHLSLVVIAILQKASTLQLKVGV
jgi:hypothetical protein